MSTIRLEITAIGTGIEGSATLGFNDGAVASSLLLISKDGPSIQGYFSRIPTDLPSDPDAAQASAFAQAFVRDFKNVGGNNNLTAVVENGSEVLITAKNGQFDTFAFTGLWVANLGISNEPFASPLVFDVLKSDIVGDCTTIRYSSTLSGGTSPYTINNGITPIQTGWDGLSIDFDLDRGSVNTLNVIDNDGNTESLTVNVPRGLKIGEFKQRSTQFEGYSDILIESVNEVTGTTPVEYSLDGVSEITGQNYQLSNSFPGVLPGLYNLFIKDKYGCEISKTIEVRDFQDVTVNENPKHFEVMSANSLIVSPCKNFDASTKKNFENTGSWNEFADINHRIKQDFDPVDGFIGTQFKSSYPYHIITLDFFDGTMKDIAPIMIQENLGTKEKVDCVIFPVNGKTGVFFDGGNLYEPNTTTIIGASPHQPNAFNNKTFLPEWAVDGQLVFIDGLGGKYIEGSGYDDDRGGYFIVDAVTPAQLDSRVQVTYNVQIYNLFECYINVEDIDNIAKIKFEKGFSFSQIDGDPWVSEIIRKTNDTNRHVLIEWSSEKNRGGMVFQSGIQCRNRIVGKFRPIWDGEAETALEDSGKSSLKQSSYQDYRLEFESLSAKQVDKLNIISGLDNGDFKVNGLGMVRNDFPEIEPLEESNRYSWAVNLSSSGDNLSIDNDEFVLEVSTGVIGGGGTGKEVAGFLEIKPLTINGKLITVDDKLLVMD